jgi:hypothetical protein
MKACEDEGVHWCLDFRKNQNADRSIKESVLDAMPSFDVGPEPSRVLSMRRTATVSLPRHN